MRKYLLLTGAALIGFSGAAYAAIDCAVPPTCDELGYAYTADWCEDQAMLKCPFDQEKVFCGEPDNSVECYIGSVLYSDLKCYDTPPAGKTAIGIVFDTSKKLAIALEQKNNIPWGRYGTDISTLTNCTTSNYTSCSTDGKSNTQKIVAALGESSDYAAGLCYTLTHGGLPKGSWFLPSASELKTLWDNQAAVNTGLASLGSPSLPTSGYYWSSTETGSYSALVLKLGGGSGGGYMLTSYKSGSSSLYSARCAVAY